MRKGLKNKLNSGHTKSREQLEKNNGNDDYKKDEDVFIDELNRRDTDEYHENTARVGVLDKDHRDREHTPDQSKSHRRPFADEIEDHVRRHHLHKETGNGVQQKEDIFEFREELNHDPFEDEEMEENWRPRRRDLARELDEYWSEEY